MGILNSKLVAALFLFLLLAQTGLAAPNGTTVLAGDILAKVKAGEPVDYSGVKVSGDLNLSQVAQVYQEFRVANSNFLGNVSLDGTIFRDSVDLKGSTFEGFVSFDKSQFSEEASFSRASFLKDVSFRLAGFSRATSFRSCRFLENAIFDNTKFDGNADFKGALFGGAASFVLAQFTRPTSFQNAIFFNTVSFESAQFGDATDFRNSTFKDDASFPGTRFLSAVFFGLSRFDKGALFAAASFGGFFEFTGVEFNDTAIFALARFADNAHFVGAVFHKDLSLESARVYSIQLDNVTFGENSTINLKDADFTKFPVHWDILKDRLDYNGATYLALVKNYKSLEWFDDADDCYYQYRMISLTTEHWGWSKIADFISWISCGFGVRVSYVSLWCLITIFIFGVIFWAGNGMRRFEHEGLEIPGGPEKIEIFRVSLVDAMYFSVAMFTTSQAPVNNYPVRFYRHLAMLEGILGWFFMGLFVVVLSGILIR